MPLSFYTTLNKTNRENIDLCVFLQSIKHCCQNWAIKLSQTEEKGGGE